MPQLPQGRLSLSKLPPDVASGLWNAAVSLHSRLEEATKQIIDLWLTDNRRTMMSIRRTREGLLRLRLHHMFVDAEERHIVAISTLLTSHNTTAQKIARDTVTSFTQRHHEKIRRFDPPKRRIRIRTAGNTHDLNVLYHRVVREHFDKDPKLTITWGRWGRPGSPLKSIRLGSFDARRGIVRVHPILDRPAVPEWVVAYIIFHELLHDHLPPLVRRGKKTAVHHDAFCERERQHPDHDRFEAWVDSTLSRLMSQGDPR